jgi:hypothetical protein
MKNLFKLLFLILLLVSCSDDDDSGTGDFDGSIQSLEQFYTPELVQALEDLGFIINEGSEPPNIEGVFFGSPIILDESSVPGDEIGSVFSDYILTFLNQDNQNLQVDFQGQSGSQSDDGFGSLISGENNTFSVYLKTTSQIEDSVTVETAFAISGKLIVEGIENLQIAVLMLDDKGDPDGIYIENNTGRLLYDSDLFSPKQ